MQNFIFYGCASWTTNCVFGVWVGSNISKGLVAWQVWNCMFVNHLVNEKYLVAVAANLALFRCVDLASYPDLVSRPRPAFRTESWAGPGYEARLTFMDRCAASALIRIRNYPSILSTSDSPVVPKIRYVHFPESPSRPVPEIRYAVLQCV